MDIAVNMGRPWLESPLLQLLIKNFTQLLHWSLEFRPVLHYMTPYEI